MSTLKNKIDFVALISVTRANGNGDPLNGNRPRTDLNGLGKFPMYVSSVRSGTECRIWESLCLFSRRTGAAMALGV